MSLSLRQGVASDTTSITIAAPAFPIIVFQSNNTNTAISAPSSTGAAYTLFDQNNGSAPFSFGWRVDVATTWGTGTTITAGTNAHNIGMLEFSGSPSLSATGDDDAFVGSTSQTGSNTTTGFVTANAHDILIAFSWGAHSTNATTFTAPGAPWVLGYNTSPSGNHVSQAAYWREVFSTGTYSITQAWTGTGVGNANGTVLLASQLLTSVLKPSLVHTNRTARNMLLRR